MDYELWRMAEFEKDYRQLKLDYENMMAERNAYYTELAECKFQLSAFDSQLLKPSDKVLNWQGINKECKGWQDRAEKAEKELSELLEKVLKLAGALKDCMSYIDVDNLTMQANYRDWENALRAAVEKKPANISKCPDCGREKAKDAVESSMGFCPKWWAIHDHEAHEDCRRTAVGQ